MIRSVHDLACVLLGAILIICIVAFKEDWAIVPLVTLIPWDKVFVMVDKTLHEHYTDKQARESGKYLRLDASEETRQWPSR